MEWQQLPYKIKTFMSLETNVLQPIVAGILELARWLHTNFYVLEGNLYSLTISGRALFESDTR